MSSPTVSDSWAKYVFISVRKVPASPAGHLHDQRWITTGNERLPSVPAHSVGSRTSSWVLICPCSPLFHTQSFFPTDYPAASGPRNTHRSNSLSYCLSYNCTAQIPTKNPFLYNFLQKPLLVCLPLWFALSERYTDGNGRARTPT